MKEKQKTKMAEGHREQREGPNREDKEDEQRIRKKWRKHGEEIERTKYFFQKKRKFNQSNCRI